MIHRQLCHQLCYTYVTKIAKFQRASSYRLFGSSAAVPSSKEGNVQENLGALSQQKLTLPENQEIHRNSHETNELIENGKESAEGKERAEDRSESDWLPEEIRTFRVKLISMKTKFISFMESELRLYPNHECLRNELQNLDFQVLKTKQVVSLIQKASTDEKAIVSKIIKENHKSLTLPLGCLMNEIDSANKKPPVQFILELVYLNLLLDDPLTARSLFLKKIHATKRLTYDSWFHILDFVASTNIDLASQDVIEMLRNGISPVSSTSAILPKILYTLTLRKSFSSIELLIFEIDKFTAQNKNRSSTPSIWTPNLALILLKAYKNDFSKILPMINTIMADSKTSQKSKTHLVCSVLYQALIQNDTLFVTNLLQTLQNNISKYRPVFRILMKHAINSKNNHDALSLFSQMKERYHLTPSITDWVLYSQALLADGQFKKAIGVIGDHIVDQKSRNTESEGLELPEDDSLQIGHPWMQKKNRIHPATIAFNNVIAEFARRDLILEAERTLQQMIDLGIEVTEFSVLPLIHYYGKNGMEKHAVAHYKRLLTNGTPSILAITSIYSHWLKRHYPEFHDGLRTYSTMPKSNWSGLIESFPALPSAKDHSIKPPTFSLPYPKSRGKEKSLHVVSGTSIPPECPDMATAHLKFCTMLKTYDALDIQSQLRVNRSLFQHHCLIAGHGDKSPRFRNRYGSMTDPKIKNVHAIAAEQYYFLFRFESVNGIYESALLAMFRERGEEEKVERILNHSAIRGRI